MLVGVYILVRHINNDSFPSQLILQNNPPILSPWMDNRLMLHLQPLHRSIRNALQGLHPTRLPKTTMAKRYANRPLTKTQRKEETTSRKRRTEGIQAIGEEAKESGEVEEERD